MLSNWQVAIAFSSTKSNSIEYQLETTLVKLDGEAK